MTKNGKRYGCGQTGGDCPVGARDDENYCLYPKYCSKKVPINERT